MTSAVPFLQARDLLLRLRDDQAAAAREFRWPALGEFNWALDHFDAMARDPHAPMRRRCGSSARTAAR
ncbi:hypothetical protein X551_00678 [Methylibium sp. T29]|nr:hypothetical protein X551_00678 [Methylibium sp. T29]